MATPLPWSHSSLSQFETCGRQYEELKVLRNFQDQKNPASLWGDEVHKAFEKWIEAMLEWMAIEGVEPPRPELPANMVHYEPYLRQFIERPGKTFVEREYALDRNLKPCAFLGPDCWARGIIDVLTLDGNVAWVDDHKGLALETELPTPNGFTTMRDVCVGDTLFDSQGRPCKVLLKSAVHTRPCFRVTFSDKTTVVCDNVHLWSLVGGTVKPVTELRRGDLIPIIPGLELAAADLPVDPYVLGLWLADGKRTSGEISKPDDAVWAEIQARGYAVDMETGGSRSCPTRTVKGLLTQLRGAGLLGNKHIPAVYMRASFAQRLQLLQGLMDGDGNPNPVRNQCVFSNTNLTLAQQVKQLLCSLGQRPTMNVHNARGFGVVTPVAQIAFRPQQGIVPFLLPRKVVRCAGWGVGDSWCRRVLSVEEVDSVPTQCIGVDSPDNTYLCTRDFIVTHNTGKNRKKDMQQLIIFALLTFYHHPEIDTIHTTFHWLQLNAKDSETFTRAQIPALWETLVPKLERYAKAFHIGIFHPKQSGLCRKHCAVSTCEYYGESK